MSRREERDSGFGSNSGTYRAQPGATDPALQGPIVTAFRIDVQFAGKAVKLEEAQSLSAGGMQPGSQAGGFGGGESRRGRRGRDE